MCIPSEELVQASAGVVEVDIGNAQVLGSTPPVPPATSAPVGTAPARNTPAPEPATTSACAPTPPFQCLKRRMDPLLCFIFSPEKRRKKPLNTSLAEMICGLHMDLRDIGAEEY
ncbi:unnamed protein product [Ilex paraguariensis]|uniref:Uncharacterized protein n=1 Tax=Ilex paraguariensis TaxID=185542 RepID=A0ABC8T3B2_9AQUA